MSDPMSKYCEVTNLAPVVDALINLHSKTSSITEIVLEGDRYLRCLALPLLNLKTAKASDLACPIIYNLTLSTTGSSSTRNCRVLTSRDLVMAVNSAQIIKNLTLKKWLQVSRAREGHSILSSSSTTTLSSKLSTTLKPASARLVHHSSSIKLARLKEAFCQICSIYKRSLARTSTRLHL